MKKEEGGVLEKQGGVRYRKTEWPQSKVWRGDLAPQLWNRSKFFTAAGVTFLHSFQSFKISYNFWTMPHMYNGSGFCDRNSAMFPQYSTKYAPLLVLLTDAKVICSASRSVCSWWWSCLRRMNCFFSGTGTFSSISYPNFLNAFIDP